MREGRVMAVMRRRTAATRPTAIRPAGLIRLVTPSVQPIAIRPAGATRTMDMGQAPGVTTPINLVSGVIGSKKTDQSSVVIAMLWRGAGALS